MIKRNTGGSYQQAHTLDDMPSDLKAAVIAALERDLSKSGAGDS